MLTISQDKCQEIYAAAEKIYQSSPDWTSFFRTVLGVDGVIRTSITNPQELAAFEQSDEFDKIQELLAKLRERTIVEVEDQEPTKVITVRLPKCLHESLRSEAHERKTSMNKLCISKLLQIIDGKLVPTDTPSRATPAKEKNGQAPVAASSGESSSWHGQR